MAALKTEKQHIDHLIAATATLRVRVDALRSSPEAPKEVVEAALNDLRSLQAEMKPLAAVASEFAKRWQSQKNDILKKRESDIEHHLRQACEHQVEVMEAEAVQKLDKVKETFAKTRQEEVEALHRQHADALWELVGEWKDGSKHAQAVKEHQVQQAVERQIAKIVEWAVEEETRIMTVWEEELSDMMCAVHTLDEEEIVAMEGARFARCNIMEDTVARQQQELLAVRNEAQSPVNNATRTLMKMSQPSGSRGPAAKANSRAMRAKAYGKKEAEVASQLHVDVAVRYLDEAATLERARVAAYNASMQDVGPELAEQLQHRLMNETEAASAKSMNAWGSGQKGSTAAGLPKSFGDTDRGISPDRPMSGMSPRMSADGGISSDEEEDPAIRLQNEVNKLREKARTMMAAVGRGDWRKDITEVADSATEGLWHTEAALAAGPLHVEKRSPRSTMEALSTIHDYAIEFSDNVAKEYTRMRNAKVALSCARSKLVRESMQSHEKNSREIEDLILPVISHLAHEVEVIREVIEASKGGKEKMPVYVIAASWQRALLATLPIVKRLWEVCETADADRKAFIRKMCILMAMNEGSDKHFEEESLALEATMPAQEWDKPYMAKLRTLMKLRG